MCLADMLSSLAYFFSSWPMPIDSDAVFAAGNEATCRIQGFFIQFSIASQIYVASIGAFYILAIKYGWKEKHFTRWGPLFHIIPMGVGLGSAITITVLDIVGPANLWCWIAPQEDRPDLDVNLYRMALFYGPLWFAMVFVGVNLCLVFLYVHNVTKVAEGHVTKWMPQKSFRGITEDAEDSEEDIYCGQVSSDSSSSEEEKTEDELREDSSSTSLSEDADHGRVTTIVRKKQEAQIKLYAKRRKGIAFQCLRFAMAFYIAWTPLSCVRILQLLGKPVPYSLLVMAAFLAPIQGLPNLIAFLYPMMRKKWNYRKHTQKTEQQKPKDDATAMKAATDGSSGKKPTRSANGGVNRPSAWELAMGYENKLRDPESFEERESTYMHPEIYFMSNN